MRRCARASSAGDGVGSRQVAERYVASVAGIARDSFGLRISREELHDHRDVQERLLACARALPEADCPRPDLMDVDGRDEHDEWTLADHRRVRLSRCTSDVLRRPVR